jgi:hypothetical protein
MASHAPQHPPHDPRRNSVRYATQLLVRFGLTGLDRLAPVANLSAGGMCIRTNDVFKTGSRIQLAIAIGG